MLWDEFFLVLSEELLLKSWLVIALLCLKLKCSYFLSSKTPVFTEKRPFLWQIPWWNYGDEIGLELEIRIQTEKSMVKLLNSD